MKFTRTDFEGLFIVDFHKFEDHRGILVKPWISHELCEVFGENMETYITHSYAATIRGLHFQTGINEQKKFITCLKGKIEDVAVDIRNNSATYGMVFQITLNAFEGKGVIIPSGFAHGVYAHDDSLFINFSDKHFSPGDEGGILWSSIPQIRDLSVKFISEKDQRLPTLEEVLF